MGEKAKKAGKSGKGAKAGKPKGGGRKGGQQAAPEAAFAGLLEDLREAGAKLVAAANSPAGREAIAVGLSIAATAAQAALTSKQAKGKGAKPAPVKAESEASQGTAEKPGKAKGSIGEDALAAVLGNVAELALAKVFPRKG